MRVISFISAYRAPEKGVYGETLFKFIQGHQNW